MLKEFISFFTPVFTQGVLIEAGNKRFVTPLHGLGGINDQGGCDSFSHVIMK